MTTVQKIMSGYDGSPGRGPRCGGPHEEAARRGAELTVLRVWPWLGPSEPEGPSTDPVRRAEHEDLEAVAREVAAAHPELAVAVQAAAGPAADALVDAAEEYDLVVLGSQDPGVLAEWLGGSVALAVAGRAGCPVALVRERPAEEDAPLAGPDARLTASAARPVPEGALLTASTGADTGLAVAAPAPPAARQREIVVGVAGESSLPAVEFALAEAASSGGRVRAVHGWDMVPFWAGAPGWVPPDPDVDRQGALIAADLDRMLDTARAAHPGVELGVEAHLGGPADGLLSAAEHADLLVLGRHPRLLGHLGGLVHAAVRRGGAPLVLVPHD